MTKVELTWRWTLQSPLHCGSGLSRPGYADRLVLRDANGRAFIQGDAVKDAIRMSAEQVVAWLGSAETYQEGGTVEPQSAVLAALFGGTARCHFNRADPLPPKGGASLCVPATAIEPNGVAKKDTLRTVEVVPPGVPFKASCVVWLPDEKLGEKELVEPALTLLVAALAATESIGGKAGIGWGRLDLSSVELRRDGKADENIAAYCSHQRLQALTAALAKRIGEIGPEPLQVATKLPTVWKKLIIELQEPTCLGSLPGVSNQILTADVVPATGLRGALRDAWQRQGISADRIATWLSNVTRWSPALPAGRNNEWLAPVPLSFDCEKNESGFGLQSLHGIHDRLSDQQAPVADQPSNGEARPIQWRGVKARWMTPDAGREARVETHTTMHVARDYLTGSKRRGALFSREHVTEIAIGDQRSRRFVAYAYVPDDVDFGVDFLLVGKRISAGHGRATLKAATVPGPHEWTGTNAAPQRDARDIFVQLLSPALVRGRNGFWLRSLSADTWRTLLGLDPDDLCEINSSTDSDAWPSAIRSAAKRLGSWMKPWGHARAVTTCIAENSVWRLRCRDEKSAAAVRKQLQTLQRAGLGERTHEGFGWFVVDPPWLGHMVGKSVATLVAPNPPTGGGDARRWPGCEHLGPQQQREIEALADAVRKLSHETLRKIEQPLQELARRARDEGAAPAAILALADAKAARPHPRAWKPLGRNQDTEDDPKVRKLLDGVAELGISQLRFALEAMLICATEERP